MTKLKPQTASGRALLDSIFQAIEKSGGSVLPEFRAGLNDRVIAIEAEERRATVDRIRTSAAGKFEENVAHPGDRLLRDWDFDDILDAEAAE